MQPTVKIDTVEDFAQFLADVFNNHAKTITNLQVRIEKLENYVQIVEARRIAELEKKGK